MNRRNALKTLLIYIALFGLVILAINLFEAPQTKEMSYTELMQKIEENNVQSIELGTSRLNAEVKPFQMCYYFLVHYLF